MPSDMPETLLLVTRDPGLEQDRVSTELCVQQRIVSQCLFEYVYTLVPLLKVLSIFAQGDRTSGT